MLVTVAPYDPLWEALYEIEARRISGILENVLAEIHHIGSTAVPNLSAKPIIDIMPVVTRIDLVDLYNSRFEALGYECRGEFGIAGRRYFHKGGDRAYHIHIFARHNNKDIARHLAVRDYLRTHPEAAAAYGRLKSELAAEFPQDIGAYCAGKDAFVKRLESDALLWYHSKTN